MFTTLIVQPLFNLLTLIYALLPGHNFGMAIILFTIVIRMLMWPLVKKQLHHAKAMRALQPELKKIKAATKGDRQKESMMVMELYKERQINPFASIGILIVQIPILLGLYAGLQRIVKDPNTVVTFSYPFIQNLSWMKELAADISKFDMTLFGVVDLKRAALNPGGGVYWPAMFIVVASCVAQYYQSKQLMPSDKEGRGLRKILKDAGQGRQADQAEVNAAIGRNTKFFIPVLIFFFTVNIASALSLYWLVSGLVAFIQQSYILRKDEEEMEAIADSPLKVTRRTVIEGEVIESQKTPVNKKKAKKSSKKSKRRK
jgi:YidC/Oxa1 family membrane protein insertase